MICFLTSLRHPAIAKDYRAIEMMLRDSLASALADPDPRIRVVVVGHVEPGFPLPDRVAFVRVDLAPPATRNGRLDNESIRKDKGSKLAIAAAYAARHFDPAYVAMLDADDFVSRRLASFILDAPAGNGWAVNQGYAYSSAQQKLLLLNNFHMKCGTSLIYNTGHVQIPPWNDQNPANSIDTMDMKYIKEMYGSHIMCHKYLNPQGHHLRPVPFPGAVYLIETGQNSVGFSTEQIRHVGELSMTPEIRSEFSLP